MVDIYDNDSKSGLFLLTCPLNIICIFSFFYSFPQKQSHFMWMEIMLKFLFSLPVTARTVASLYGSKHLLRL